MASQILSHFKQRILSLTLVPSGGGCFELSLDRELVYSKLETGVFPDEARMLALIDKRLNTAG